MEKRPMKTMDRNAWAEWLDWDVDGSLGTAEKTRLDERLAGDPELAAERLELESLHATLGASRIAVREGFKEQVMASLPRAAWQPGRVPAWALPLAMMLVLGLGAAALLANGSASAGPLASAALAVVDSLKATLLAGAGLLGASWRGAGLVLEEVIASSTAGLVAMAVLVLCLNLLLVSLLKRRHLEVKPLLERAAAGDEDPSDVP